MARFLVILDVDSTLVENEVIELLAEEAGSLREVADITTRAMNGELDFEQSLRSRVSTLAGLPNTVFDTIRDRVVLTAGVPELIDGVHRGGGHIAIVSGGFAEIVDPLARTLGLDYWRANQLEVVDGVVTGRVLGAVIDAEAKATALREWAADSDVDLNHTVAVGDGANDLRMMAIAGLSVGFDAKERVRLEADVVLSQRDLSHILPLLGLRG
ncbi:MAG: phosphoserine phosphatase [Glaciihabitans sp.]|nr:phosphoserine phosphatase [Glaciihabitans sp.]